jgi:hypothetical protein
LSFLISLRTPGITSSIPSLQREFCANPGLRGDRARYGPRARRTSQTLSLRLVAERTSLVSRHAGPTPACN